MPSRVTRQLLAAALFGGSVASAAEPPKPVPVRPPIPPAPGMVAVAQPEEHCTHLRCEVVEVPTVFAQAFTDAARFDGPNPMLDPAATYRLRAALQKLPDTETLSRPELLLQNGQTGFFQVCQQLPLPTGGAHNASHLEAGITLRVNATGKRGNGPVNLGIEFKWVDNKPVQVAAGITGIDSTVIEAKVSVPAGHTAVLASQAGRGRTLLVLLTPSGFGTSEEVAAAAFPPRAIQPVAHATAVAPRPVPFVVPPPPATAPVPVLPQPFAVPLPVTPVAPPKPVAAPVPSGRVFHVRDLTPPPAALVTRVFPVADLITPIPLGVCLPSADPDASREATDAAGRRHAEQLQKLITETVRPDSWAAAGGKGRIEFFAIGGSFAVCNSPDALAEVERVLDAVRRTQDVQASAEVRVVCLPAGSATSAKLCDGPLTADKPVVLTDARRAEVLAALDACPQARTMRMPKVTAFNGQSMEVVVGVPVIREAGESEVIGHNGEPGVRMCVQPLVSADRRTVRTAVDVRIGFGNETLRVKRDAALPDGHTLVLLAGTHQPAAVCGEFGPPVLSRIPYVNRLFTTRAVPPAEDVYVLVTPRVIVASEEEVRQTAGTVPASPAAELVAQYHAALAAGRPDEAVRCAVQALAADPKAFGR